MSVTFSVWECIVCGWVYDESLGYPEDGISPGTRWEDVPEDWECPECGVGKSDFEMVRVSTEMAPEIIAQTAAAQEVIEQQSAVASEDSIYYQVWECVICGVVYDEALGYPEDGIAAGTRWEDVPDDWECPDCGVGKSDFELLGPSKSPAAEIVAAEDVTVATSTAIESQVDWSQDPVIVVGTGLAGYNLVREIRKKDRQIAIVMITEDDGSFYSKPLLSNGYVKNKTAEQLATFSAEAMARELDIRIRIFTRVTAIDVTKQALQLGDENLAYSKLVLANGAACINAPVNGDAASQVYHINNLMDYSRFRTAMVGRKRILVIGAGLIGSEYANDLIQSGFEVDVVEPMPSVLATLLPEAASNAVAGALTQVGVNFHFGTVVESISKADGALNVRLKNGKEVVVDAVLSAIGVRPRIDLAKAAGLEVNRGVVVNRQLQSSDQHIYALGDCAEVDGHVLFFVAPLMDSARALAKTLTGTATPVCYGAMPVAIKTTLCPVVVSPPSRGAEGDWTISTDEADKSSVIAEFKNAAGELLGFALTGRATSERNRLTAGVVPIMITEIP